MPVDVDYSMTMYQIARLYRPLTGSATDFEEEDEDESMGTQLLPTHYVHNNLASLVPLKKARLADVWDERDDVFDIGADSDEEHDATASVSRPQPTQPSPPRIVISHS